MLHVPASAPADRLPVLNRTWDHAPVVSVIVPVRNGGRFLRPALESVLAQAGVPFDVICVDDGSADETWPTLLRLARQHPNLHVEQAQGRGISEALNQALGTARGRYVAR